MSEKNVFRAKLMRWGESSASGRTVTFKLPDDTEEHPFKGLAVGSKNGQLVEIEVELVEGDLPLETLDADKREKARASRVGPKVRIVREKPVDPRPITAPRAHIIDKRPVPAAATAPTTKAPANAAPTTTPTTTPNTPGTDRLAPPTSSSSIGKPSDRTPMPNAWAAPAIPRTAAFTPPAPAYAPPSFGTFSPAPPTAAPMPAPALHPAVPPTGPAPDIGAYASRMSQAAEALASVAERIGGHPTDEDDGHHHQRSRYQLPRDDEDEDDEKEPVGVRTVKRAVELCTAVDKKRAGFFYYMRALYPTVPVAENDGGDWSRDAKVTRDRVCFHCDTLGIMGLADDSEARKRFEELERAFEKHERLR